MKLALVGMDSHAEGDHLPAIAASPDWEVAACLACAAPPAGAEDFASMEALLHARPDVRVLALGPRANGHGGAAAALRAGRHVMLPQGAGVALSECRALKHLARENRVTLYAPWPGREAPALRRARRWLAGRRVIRADLRWRGTPAERGARPAGPGLLGPGLEALSLLTGLLPQAPHLQAARLDIPAGQQAPVAAHLRLSGAVTVDLEAPEPGPARHEIAVETETGRLWLDARADRLSLDGAEAAPAAEAPPGAYPRLYDRFARLVKGGGIEMDLGPLALMADAFMLGERRSLPPFD